MRISQAVFFSAFAATAALAESAADYFVRSLPGQPDGPLPKMHAGHIVVDPEHNGNLWFWHVQEKHIAEKERTVIWLNGGPGCSSLDGALMEIGPFRVTKDEKLVPNNGSWHEFANLLFVDQPVGTGFSFVDTNAFLHELPEMANQFIIFLEEFFKVFPHYETDDIYLAGESYAGQHIPYIAQAILDRNARPLSKIPWNLKGLLIGNGWIDPEPQYDAYLSYAYKQGLVTKDSSDGRALEAQLSKCHDEIAKHGVKVSIDKCEQVLQDILQKTIHKNKAGEEVCWNMYDIRLTDSYPSCGMRWPPDLEQMSSYLRRQDVTSALHVKADKKSGWVECAGAVSSAFRARNSKPSITLLPKLLEKMPVLLFSGDKDLICNHIGTEDSINNMEWNGGKGFETTPGQWAPRHDWTFEGEAAGIYQSARNLTYVLFYNASHMVPFDYPRRTRDMLDRFIGVDIGKIGGVPTDSRIGGEKVPETSVGGTPAGSGSGSQSQAEKDKLDKARWDAYYHSGQIALILVASAAAIWLTVICCARRRRRHASSRTAAYHSLNNGSSGGVSMGKGKGRAASFDDNELEDLAAGETPMFDRSRDARRNDMDEDRYSIGGLSDEEDIEARAAAKKGGYSDSAGAGASSKP